MRGAPTEILPDSAAEFFLRSRLVVQDAQSKDHEPTRVENSCLETAKKPGRLRQIRIAFAISDRACGVAGRLAMQPKRVCATAISLPAENFVEPSR